MGVERDRAGRVVFLVAALAVAASYAAPNAPRRGFRGLGPLRSEEHEYAAVYDEDDDDYASSGEGDDEYEAGDKDIHGEGGLRRGRHVGEHHGAVDKATTRKPPLETFLGPILTFETRERHQQCPPAPSVAFCRAGRSNSAARCLSDRDCVERQGQQGQQGRPGTPRCCFNGCTNTCLETVDPPLVVDWEEETPDVLHPAELPAPVVIPAPSHPQHSLAAPEVVALVGGCTMTRDEYRRMEEFKKGGHVRKCFCNNGTVLCQVNPN